MNNFMKFTHEHGHQGDLREFHEMFTNFAHEQGHQGDSKEFHEMFMNLITESSFVIFS